MKTLVLLLCLLSPVALAQQYITVTPQIATLAVDSCTVSTTIDTVTAPAASFASVVAGQRVYGVGIPENTTVLYTDSTTYVVLSATPTQGGVKILNFGILANTTYGTGDWFGQPFRIYYDQGSGGMRTLETVFMTENADLLVNTDVVLFNAYCDSLGQDSSAAAVIAGYAHNVVGYVSLSTAVDLGTGRHLVTKDINLSLPREGLWGRLIAKGTILPTAINNIKIRFGLK